VSWEVVRESMICIFGLILLSFEVGCQVFFLKRNLELLDLTGVI
jgi:hypothetical protein